MNHGLAWTHLMNDHHSLYEKASKLIQCMYLKALSAIMHDDLVNIMPVKYS